MFGGKWMDTFMDKLAQKLNAQEMIKANSAADAEEMNQLKNQLREYDECLAQITICRRNESCYCCYRTYCIVYCMLC